MFDFTTKPDRKGKDALAVDLPLSGGGGSAPGCPDEGFDLIPMWVADMNFRVCPSIQDAIIRRTEEPHFGYYAPRKEYYQAIISHQEHLYQVKGLSPADIGYENGVLGGVSSAINALTAPGESILLHSPTYIGFTHCLKENGRNIVLSPLRKDLDGVWRMDYADMEEKINMYHIHLAVLCSPHNPTGRVWDREELRQAMDIFRKKQVVVISDEIWCDLTMPGITHIPTQQISEDSRNRTIAFYAPSKTFNLAGLIGSYHIIYNPCLRDKVIKCSAATFYNEMNVLSQHALIGAYSDTGRAWLSELREVLKKNVDLACDFFTGYEGISIYKPQGTYMLFADFSEYLVRTGKTLDEILQSGHRVGVGWQDGRFFNGKTHIRINLALPTAYVKEALQRLREYVLS